MKVLLVHPDVGIAGGAELVALHVMRYFIEQQGAEVTLLGFAPPDPDRVFQRTGLDILRHVTHVAFQRAFYPWPLERVLGAMPLLRVAFLNRAARRMAANYDLCIGTFNEIDFGRRGLQYIHHPLFPPRALLRAHHIIPERSEQGKALLLTQLYEWLLPRVSGDRLEGYRRNLTLTNSQFIQQAIQTLYGIESTVLYPGFLSAPGQQAAPTGRAFRFVSIGRISPEKHTLDLIDLFTRLYAKHPAAEFVVAGAADDPAYLAQVQTCLAASGAPIDLRINLSRDEIDRLLRGSRFFVNPRPYEHFGIVTLEALQAGCLPFVHQSGGSVEIIPFDELQFRTPDDFAQKAGRVIEDTALQARLQASLAEQAERFTLAQFDEVLHAVVTAFLADAD